MDLNALTTTVVPLNRQTRTWKLSLLSVAFLRSRILSTDFTG